MTKNSGKMMHWTMKHGRCLHGVFFLGTESAITLPLLPEWLAWFRFDTPPGLV